MGTVSTYGVLDTSKPYIESTIGYDSTGNYATSVSDQRGNTTTYNINLLTGLTNSITDPSGTTTSYTYDNITLLLEAVTSGDSSVSYEYDQYNRLTQIQHNGFTYHFAYDKFGNTSTVKVGDQTLMTNTYGEGNGLLLSETYGNGTVYAYTYDEYGRVIKVSINGTDRYATVYNAKGQIAEIKDLVNNEKTVYTYDMSGRLLKISQSGGKSISTGYDILNRVTAINYQFAGQTKTVSFGYGQDGQKGESTLLSGATQTATYDTLGRETASAVGDLTRSVSYLNVSGNRTTTLPQTLTYTQDDATLLTTSYAYDNRGNISQMTVDGITYTYTYDSLNQLTGVTTSDDSFTATYSYDNGGNITSKTVNGITTPYGYTDTNWKDKLTSYNGQAISYDTMGNPTQNYIGSFSWVGRQLTTIAKTDGTQLGYTYNDSGIRTKKTVGGVVTEYFLQGSTILAEKTGNNVIWYIYDTGGELLGFTYNGTPYYYLKNMQGDVYKVVDANGTVVASYTYDPWGKVLSATGTMAQINPIRYRSYYYDSETGLYYLQSRYYDPELGRFVNGDCLLNQESAIGNNMFAYSLNNPVNMADTSGNLPFFVITAALGAVGGAIAGGIIAAKAGGNVWAGIGIGAAAGALIGTGVGMAAGAALAGSIAATATQVAMGAGTLATTVATGGLGAGVAYVTNNLSQAISNSTSTVQATANKMQQVYEKGKAGELAANITKNHTHIDSLTGTANYRIPDMLDHSAKILGEVKNYSGTISLTAQLKDFVLWSQLNGYQMYLFTNSTSFTGPLQQLIDNGVIQVIPIG